MLATCDNCAKSAHIWVSINLHKAQQMSHATCSNCQSEFDLSRILAGCPKCGTPNAVASRISIGGVEILPSVRVKITNPSYKGKHKYAREMKSVAEHSVSGRLVRVTQLIDRSNDRYGKKVVDVDTGEVLREANHNLSQHTGHGSDKLRRKED
jgi:predicted  nucleic acid-binding Zn-ribbon protein